MAVEYLDPTSDVTNNWTKSSGAAGWSLLDDAVRQPTAPSTGTDRITSSTAAQVQEVAVGDPSISPDHTLSSAWVHCSGGTKRGIEIQVFEGATARSSVTSVGAAAAAAWVEIPLTSAPTDWTNLRVRMTCVSTAGGGGATAVAVNAVYIEAVSPSGIDAYTFDGTNDSALFDQGALSGVGGDVTLAVLCRRPETRSSEDTVLSIEGAGGDIWAMFFAATSGNLGLWNGFNFVATGAPVTASTGWATVGWSHTSGGTTPRSHVIPPSPGSPTHQNAAAGISNSANTTPTLARLGSNSTGTKWTKADFAVVAVWDRVLSDSEWEALMTNDATQDWLDLSPVACWHAGDDFATDLTGNGADLNTLSGATLSNDGPAGWDYTVSTTTAIGESLAMPWDTTGVVAESLGIKWDTRELVGESLGIKWDTRELVGESLAIPWDTIGIVAESLGMPWDTQAFVGESLAMPWDTKVAVGESLGVVWDGIAAIGESLAMPWDTTALVGESLAMPWDLSAAITAIGESLAMPWDTTVLVGESLAMPWDTQVFVGESLGVKWDTTGMIGESLGLRWNVGDLNPSGRTHDWRTHIRPRRVGL